MLRVVAQNTETSLTSTSIVLSSANFTSAPAHLTSELSEYPTGRGAIITRVSWLSAVYRRVTLRLRIVGGRRAAVLLLQLYSTDEKLLPFWRGELSATELQLSCWYELRRQVVCWCNIANSHWCGADWWTSCHWQVRMPTVSTGFTELPPSCRPVADGLDQVHWAAAVSSSSYWWSRTPLSCRGVCCTWLTLPSILLHMLLLSICCFSCRSFSFCFQLAL